MATLRLWLWRLFLVAVWIVVYWILPEPLDKWFGIMTSLALGIWLYNRAAARFNQPPFPFKLERVETFTLTHVLLGFILLVMIASFSALVSVKYETSDIHNSITNLHNDTSSDADEIKSKLDDVTSAVEANRSKKEAIMRRIMDLPGWPPQPSGTVCPWQCVPRSQLMMCISSGSFPTRTKRNYLPANLVRSP